jgi:hypothetical protein
MFEDYKREVLDFYRLKKASNALSVALENPERLKLKKECLMVYALKNSNEDGEIIRGFFDPSRKYNDHVKSIESFDLDKFRPLINYLTKGTTIRDEQAVKLLAWLLDFQPYDEWKASKYATTNFFSSRELAKESAVESGVCGALPEKSKADEIGTIAEQQKENRPIIQTALASPIGSDQDDEAETLPAPNNKHGNKNTIQKNPGYLERPKLYRGLIRIGIALIFLLGIAAVVQRGDMIGGTNSPDATEKCMYWDGNSYVPIKCEKKAINPAVIPLDINILKGFRRIKWADTLTKRAIGVVWYAKSGAKYEFFTDSGMHPVDTKKKLKPLTQYILSNHISYHRFILEVLAWTLSVILFTIVLFFVAKMIIGRSRLS